MREERCHACRFWRERKTGCVDDDGAELLGACRREPPRIIGSVARASGDINPGHSPLINLGALWEATLFPVTERIDWCGRFEWRSDLEPMGPLC